MVIFILNSAQVIRNIYLLLTESNKEVGAISISLRKKED